MARYSFRAATRGGEIREGTREAADPAAVAQWLQGQELIPLKITAAAAPPAAAPRARLSGLRGGGAKLELPTYVRAVATLLGAGVPLAGALGLLARYGETPAARDLSDRLGQRIRAGLALSDALSAEGAGWPEGVIAGVKAGEASGRLAVALTDLAGQLERAAASRAKLRQALTYPMVLVVVAIGAIVVLMTVVVPAFEPLFAEAGKELPPATQALLGVARFVQVAWLPLLVVPALAWIGWRQVPASAPLRMVLARRSLGLPVLGDLLLGIETGRCFRLLGTLLGNGVPLLRALHLAGAALGNRALAADLARAAEAVAGGTRLGDALAAGGLWPPLAIALTRVGEETGKLPDMLLRVAETEESQAERRTQRMLTLLGPAITLSLGALVAFVVVALLSAVMAVNDLAL